MKTIPWILVLCVLVSCQISRTPEGKTVKGNKEITVYKPEVGSFNRIEVNSDYFYPHQPAAGNLKPAASLHYVQQPGAPGVEVTVDQNLVEDLDIHIKGNTLYINSKGRRKISPTQLDIRVHSEALAKLSYAGPIGVSIDSPVCSDALEIVLAGSGEIRSSHRIDAGSLKIELSGSGDIVLTDILCRHLTGNLTGSGDIRLKGQAEEGAYQLTGSGDIKAFDCLVGKLACHITGSGDIRAHATNKLINSITGSGDIVYKGTPRIDCSITGSGKIRSLD